jgi:hypothetical protein
VATEVVCTKNFDTDAAIHRSFPGRQSVNLSFDLPIRPFRRQPVPNSGQILRPPSGDDAYAIRPGHCCGSRGSASMSRPRPAHGIGPTRKPAVSGNSDLLAISVLRSNSPQSDLHTNPARTDFPLGDGNQTKGLKSADQAGSRAEELRNRQEEAGSRRWRRCRQARQGRTRRGGDGGSAVSSEAAKD